MACADTMGIASCHTDRVACLLGGPWGAGLLSAGVQRGTKVCAALPQITDAGLLLLTRLSRLETLDLSGCVGVTEKGIKALAAALKSLHSLKLGGTSRVATIQDGSVAAIAAMTSLTHLDLSGSHDISDEGEASAYLQPPELISTNCALESQPLSSHINTLFLASRIIEERLAP